MRALQNMGGGGGTGGGSGAFSPRASTSMQSSPFAARLSRALYSTRLNMGGASPLLGQMLNVAGMKNPLGLTVYATVKAMQELTAAVKSAAENINSFAASAQVTGGTARQTGLLRGLGVNPASAMAFSRNISSSPFAMAEAGRLGLHDLPGPLGRLNKDSGLIAYIKQLRGMGDAEAILSTRMTGMEDLMPLRNLSKGQFGKVMGDAKFSATLFTPEKMQQAADFTSAMGRLGNSLGNLGVAVSGPMMKEMTDFFNGVADNINKFAGFLSGHQAQIQTVFDLLGGRLWKMPADLKAMAAGEKQQSQHDALSANTKALWANTAATREGMSGGGPRTGAAFGRHWGNADMPGKWVGEGFRMGAMG